MAVQVFLLVALATILFSCWPHHPGPVTRNDWKEYYEKSYYEKLDMWGPKHPRTVDAKTALKHFRELPPSGKKEEEKKREE